MEKIKTSAVQNAEDIGLETILTKLKSAYPVLATTENRAHTFTQRTMVLRLGALGDCIILTPLIRYLRETLNEEVYLLTSEQGFDIFKNNPFINKTILYEKNSVPPQLWDKFKIALKNGYECNRVIDMCESIERVLALLPIDPEFNYTKKERELMCNKNYYDYTFQFAGYPAITGKRGEMFFDEKEEEWARKFLANYKDKYIVLWGLSGSGRNKSYPFVPYVISDLLKRYTRLMIITVGDEACKILECGMEHPQILKMSGLWNFRQSALLTKYVNLVISPDTGLLHAAGMFDTPKIGLLGHSTKENITKHFNNDYTIESQCDCAPCFKLIYNATIQCPIEPISSGCWCMTEGLPVERVYKHICGAIDKDYYGKNTTTT